MGKARGTFAMVSDAAPWEGGESPTRSQLAARLVRVAAGARTAEETVVALAGVARALMGCAWLDGRLRMELVDDVDGVLVNFLTDRGVVREPALPPVILDGTLGAFRDVLVARPALFSPLRLHHREGTLLLA